MLTLALGVLFFTGVIVALVVVLLVAKRQLLPEGSVEIDINDDPDRTLRVRAGDTLLATLAAQRIFVPSACGGKGTCGVCKVTVMEGAGALLPSEVAHVSRREAREGVRLACQIKVRKDMKIAVPPEIFAVRRWRCRVRSNRNVATFIKELVLELPEGEEIPFRAGGYVQVRCPPHVVRYRDFEIDERYRSEWDRNDMWRYVSTVEEEVERAYSMANYPGETGILLLNVRIASPPPELPDAPPGKLSSYLFSLAPGDEVTVSGPFGEFFAHATDNEMCYIGGGAGMAPMRSHIFDQLLRLHTQRKITFWYGARSLKEAFYIEAFDALAAEHPNFEWHLALSDPLESDHWTGYTGFIHQVVHDNHLKDHPTPEEVEYYLCGPPLMMDACKAMLFELGVEPENVMFDDFGD
ncbi:MAG: NADH:ubiquinone reductase (Na(+)-transporting) subunit F [Deltaproteobacteria bacterium]|nr:MAG: NADH:ubiquinone reductase (Na(+)-transporting) subunit F [Deltaproteobacteria bacterium]